MPDLTYDQLSNEQKVYFFEFLLADAVREVFEDNEVTAYTHFTDPEFQKERPRCEIMFAVGPGSQIYQPVDGNMRESAWKGVFSIDCITAAENLIHAAFVVKIRKLMHNIGESVNEILPTMQYHRLQPFFRDAGTSAVVKPEEGLFQTTLQLEIDFSVQSDAWALLTT